MNSEEPDEALLYAREQMADDLQQNGGSAEDVAAARAGAFDTLLKVPAAFYRAGAAASAERIKELEARVAELEAALAKANKPRWFYSDAEGSPYHSLDEAIQEFCEYVEPGWHFVEVETARPCPTIRGVVHVLTDEEIEARGEDEPWIFTPCATEAEARALLKEPDQ